MITEFVSVSCKRPLFIFAIFKFAFWAWFIDLHRMTFQGQTFVVRVCSLRSLISKREFDLRDLRENTLSKKSLTLKGHPM